MDILFLLSHCSTGGGPQYSLTLTRKLLQAHLTVHVIEYNDHGGYRVQKDQFISLLGHRYHTLGSDKSELFTHLDQIKPDIVHLQEFPEYWLPDDMARRLYSDDRTYRIIETSHDSGFDPKTKRFVPDGFAFISNFHPPQYAELGLPTRIVEYPIEDHVRPDRSEALTSLQLDPNKYHILNVGLFTPRKNQAEVIQVARMFGNDVMFHFVGNQAPNFAGYWKPLMVGLPKNVKIWGERSDIDQFYSSMDLMYFASKGTDGDRETNPLVIREALGWHMPIVMRNLEVYGGKYDAYDLVSYIGDDLGHTVGVIRERLGLGSVESVNGVPVGKVVSRVEALAIANRTLERAEAERKQDPDDPVFTFSVDGNPPKFTYSVDRNMENVRLTFMDADTGLTIYTHVLSMKGGGSYWTQLEQRLEVLSGVAVKANGCEVYRLAGRRNVASVIRPDNFVTDELDRTWYTWFEVFIKEDYNSSLCSVEPGNVVLDCGANYGFFTRYALEKGAAKVYSVEPDVRTCRYLRKNVAGKPVTIIPAAIWEQTGESKLELYTGSTVSVLDGVGMKPADNKVGEALVNAYNINDLLADYKIDVIDFMKVDIEGGEYILFDTITDENLAKVRKIAMELHKVDDISYDVVLDRLISGGFDVTVDGMGQTVLVHAWRVEK